MRVREQASFGQCALPKIGRGPNRTASEGIIRNGWIEAFAADASDLAIDDREWLDAPLTAVGMASRGWNSRASD